jgi:hypothetical protein
MVRKTIMEFTQEEIDRMREAGGTEEASPACDAAVSAAWPTVPAEVTVVYLKDGVPRFTVVREDGGLYDVSAGMISMPPAGKECPECGRRVGTLPDAQGELFAEQRWNGTPSRAR